MMLSSDNNESVVFVVEDDDSQREATAALLRMNGLKVECFASAPDFLKKKKELPDTASCLVLDVRLPGASGLNLQSALANSGVHIPIIFVTGHGDIPMTAHAMKAGAVDFLTKPVRQQDLLDAIHLALERDRSRPSRTSHGPGCAPISRASRHASERSWRLLRQDL
jgi:FixJ family two-component response regulator